MGKQHIAVTNELASTIMSNFSSLSFGPDFAVPVLKKKIDKTPNALEGKQKMPLWNATKGFFLAWIKYCCASDASNIKTAINHPVSCSLLFFCLVYFLELPTYSSSSGWLIDGLIDWLIDEMNEWMKLNGWRMNDKILLIVGGSKVKFFWWVGLTQT